MRALALTVGALALALGCSAPAPAPVIASTAPDPRVAIEQAPKIEQVQRLDAARDCRLPVVARAHFAGLRVRPCGAWTQPDSESSQREQQRAVACIDDAVAQGEPFYVEEALRGIDSQVAVGFVGVREATGLVVYQLFYDSDPCGGGCPEDGHTIIRRCAPFAKRPASCGDVQRCYVCGPLPQRDNDPTVIETCTFGRKPLAH